MRAPTISYEKGGEGHREKERLVFKCDFSFVRLLFILLLALYLPLFVVVVSFPLNLAFFLLKRSKFRVGLNDQRKNYIYTHTHTHTHIYI